MRLATALKDAASSREEKRGTADCVFAGSGGTFSPSDLLNSFSSLFCATKPKGRRDAGLQRPDAAGRVDQPRPMQRSVGGFARGFAPCGGCRYSCRLIFHAFPRNWKVVPVTLGSPELRVHRRGLHAPRRRRPAVSQTDSLAAARGVCPRLQRGLRSAFLCEADSFRRESFAALEESSLQGTLLLLPTPAPCVGASLNARARRLLERRRREPRIPSSFSSAVPRRSRVFFRAPPSSR